MDFEELWVEISLPSIINSRPEPVRERPCCSALLPILQENHCLLHCPPGQRDLRHTAVLLSAEAVEGRPTTSSS